MNSYSQTEKLCLLGQYRMINVRWRRRWLLFHLVGGGESRNINMRIQRRFWREKNAAAATVHSILDH